MPCRFLLILLLALSFIPTARCQSSRDALRPELMASLKSTVDLKEGWHNPPTMARTRCWWWWLNGNVTKEGITHDLEEMKAKGLGGANIIDAGGANQRGNQQVPHGPDFGSDEWRELFVHALREADRLGLELGFNIQSGWNLGGPTVTPEHAAKKITWSKATIRGGEAIDIVLEEPAKIGDYYQEIAVLALPVTHDHQGSVQFTVESSQEEYPPSLATDGDKSTFWVSGTENRGEGPCPSKPQRLEFEFSEAKTVSKIVIYPRVGYGPKRGWVQASDSPNSWNLISRWEATSREEPIEIKFARTKARRFRLVFVDAFDPYSPATPRNVQVAEVELSHKGFVHIGQSKSLARVRNFREKAYHTYPGPFTAAKADHLLEVGPQPVNTNVLDSSEVIDLSQLIDEAGRLTWKAPQGVWEVIRIGTTLAGSRVSTSSEGWNGWAIDYLDSTAFDQYWDDVISPLLDVAGPSVGRSLRYLHTDSWELGPVNWTPKMLEAFKRLRGYEMHRYLPVLVGYTVDSQEDSNRFLNDFRRTLADLIVQGKYETFRDKAHARGLGIHPESGGPHAAPIDALKCLGRGDIAMGEFWARSRTHRVNDHERLFIKQPASAAHIYGRRLVMAEAFTSIGPHWEKDPAMLKPVFDRVACEGLNLVMLHTFDSSPPSMGLPGQVYFAGTHINPNVTWWDQSVGFFDYLNRCQFLLQQGVSVSDVLYFYGENVPSFVRLKSDNPADVPQGHDYDVINAEALLERLQVVDGKLTLPEGTQYELLVLPPQGNFGLEVLMRLQELVNEGARIVGPRPHKPIGLVSKKQQRQFDLYVSQLWDAEGNRPAKIEPLSSKTALSDRRIAPDFVFTLEDDPVSSPAMDYFHRSTDDTEIYFVVNRLDKAIKAECEFRVAGPAPELWAPLTGTISPAKTYNISNESTELPLNLPPNGSMFVIFRGPPSEVASKNSGPNLPEPQLTRKLTLDWQVQFDVEWGGPVEPVSMLELTSWPQHDDPAIKYFSGTAVYRAEFDLTADEVARLRSGRWWLDLGKVSNLARVKMNGKDLGIAWTPPYRVELSGHLLEKNKLEIEVVNLWPNRLIGDQKVPLDERITKTNVTKFQANSPLLPSGLLGPIRLLEQPNTP